MNVQNLPEIGDKLFLMHREVIVTKVYALFQLVKLRYTEEVHEFYVDACALTSEPDYTNSISLGMLRRNRGEQYHVLY
jgi:hypothetical protein